MISQFDLNILLTRNHSCEKKTTIINRSFGYHVHDVINKKEEKFYYQKKTSSFNNYSRNFHTMFEPMVVYLVEY